jgi:hypothetical protein
MGCQVEEKAQPVEVCSNTQRPTRQVTLPHAVIAKCKQAT